MLDAGFLLVVREQEEAVVQCHTSLSTLYCALTYPN